MNDKKGLVKITFDDDATEDQVNKAIEFMKRVFGAKVIYRETTPPNTAPTPTAAGGSDSEQNLESGGG